MAQTEGPSLEETTGTLSPGRGGFQTHGSRIHAVTFSPNCVSRARGDQVTAGPAGVSQSWSGSRPASLDLDGPVLQLHLRLQGGLQGLGRLCRGRVLTHRRQLDILHLDVTALER